MRLSVLFLCLILAGSACSNSSAPSGVLTEETYIDLLVELQLLRTYQKTEGVDSVSTDSLRENIFAKYGTSRSQFQRSHQFYQQDIRAQRDRIGKAVEQLRKDRLSAEDSVSARDTTLNN